MQTVVKMSPLPKILIVNEQSLAILNSLFEHADIFEANIRRIEDLSKPRMADPNKGAIYFVDTSLACVQDICRDFESGAKYAEAYVMAIGVTPDESLRYLKQSPARKYARFWRDLNLKYVAAESRVFHLDMASTLDELYAPLDMPEFERTLDQAAKGVISLLAKLQSIPHVSYVDVQGRGTNVAAHLAWHIVQNAKTLEEFKTSWASEQHARVIVVDRHIDMFTPLLHTLTYQAIIHDLLQVNRNRVTVPKASDDGRAGASTVVVDEADSVYAKLRHLFIVDAVKKWAEMLEENPATAALNRRQQTGEVSSDLDDLRKQVFASAEGTRIMAHCGLLEEVQARITARKIEILAVLEQTLATNEDSENGDAPKPTLIQEIKELLAQPELELTDKLRMVLLCRLRFPDLNLVEFGDLIDQKDAADLLRALKLLKADEFISADRKDPVWRYSHVGWRQQHQQGGSFISKLLKRRAESAETDEQFEAHRFTPVLQYLMEDLVAKKASGCPWLVSLSDSLGNAVGEEQKQLAALGRGSGSVLPFTEGTFKPTWGSAKPRDPSEHQEVNMLKNGPRVIILVVGGLTQAEIRTAYEITSMYKRDVLIGSTSLITPVQFLQELKTLGSELRPQKLSLVPVSELVAREAERIKSEKMAAKVKVPEMFALASSAAKPTHAPPLPPRAPTVPSTPAAAPASAPAAAPAPTPSASAPSAAPTQMPPIPPRKDTSSSQPSSAAPGIPPRTSASRVEDQRPVPDRPMREPMEPAQVVYAQMLPPTPALSPTTTPGSTVQPATSPAGLAAPVIPSRRLSGQIARDEVDLSDADSDKGGGTSGLSRRSGVSARRVGSSASMASAASAAAAAAAPARAATPLSAAPVTAPVAAQPSSDPPSEPTRPMPRPSWGASSTPSSQVASSPSQPSPKPVEKPLPSPQLVDKPSRQPSPLPPPAPARQPSPPSVPLQTPSQPSPKPVQAPLPKPVQAALPQPVQAPPPQSVPPPAQTYQPPPPKIVPPEPQPAAQQPPPPKPSWGSVPSSQPKPAAPVVQQLSQPATAAPQAPLRGGTPSLAPSAAPSDDVSDVEEAPWVKNRLVVRHRSSIDSLLSDDDDGPPKRTQYTFQATPTVATTSVMTGSASGAAGLSPSSSSAADDPRRRSYAQAPMGPVRAATPPSGSSPGAAPPPWAQQPQPPAAVPMQPGMSATPAYASQLAAQYKAQQGRTLQQMLDRQDPQRAPSPSSSSGAPPLAGPVQQVMASGMQIPPRRGSAGQAAALQYVSGRAHSPAPSAASSMLGSAPAPSGGYMQPAMPQQPQQSLPTQPPQPSYGRPVSSQPPFPGQPQASMYGGTGYSQPGYAQPGYAQQGYTQPGYQAPGYPAQQGYSQQPQYYAGSPQISQQTQPQQPQGYPYSTTPMYGQQQPQQTALPQQRPPTQPTTGPGAAYPGATASSRYQQAPNPYTAPGTTPSSVSGGSTYASKYQQAPNPGQ
ncbi:syntaxin binding protein 1 [Polyrhizophydium stewartii]|uniref:Syntaxin binding protein 1 n=1 Tax=Polyrhizophydium stewartii TaxID=2732419 RepID=A0ABR4N8T7_9FUNG